MMPTNIIILWALTGGAARVLIGLAKYPVYGFDYRKAIYTIIISIVMGVIFTLFIDPENYVVAFIGGFAGSDGLDAFYRGMIRRKTGVTPRSSSRLFTAERREYMGYGFGYGFYLPQMNLRQRRAFDYMVRFGCIKIGEYARINKCSQNTAANDLNRMVGAKLVRIYGSGKREFYALR